MTAPGLTRGAVTTDSLLAAAVQASADAIYTQDPDGRITSWNPAAARLYGYPADEVVGRPADVLMTDDARPVLQQVQEKALAGARVERFDSCHVRRDGSTFPVSLTAAPLLDPHGAVLGIATSVADITERVQLAQQLQETRDELERRNAALARSNRDLEQFAYVASHDLSEPLRVMTGYVEQLERRYDAQLDDRARRYMHHIVEASIRMRALIDDLLDYSRFLRAPRELAAVDLGEVVERTRTTLRPQLEAVSGTLEVAPLPSVWSDVKQMGSLLQNLLGNAVKFQEPGRAAQVRVSADAADGWVTLRVDDNGIGIAPEYRDRVFRMFQRLHVREAYAGTGIGLAIAQQIVELHGGRIWVEDSPLGGARFCCTLPAVPEADR